MILDHKKILVFAIILLWAACIGVLPGQAMDRCWNGKYPYGDYCERWDRYGARQTIKTAREARIRLNAYFSDSEVKIGKIIEKDGFFEAEIMDKNNTLLDKVIIDKRTGRIRSIF